MSDTNTPPKNLLPAKIRPDSKESLAQLVGNGVYGKNILNSITSNIIITDKDFIISYINPAAEKTFGIQAQETEGKSLFESKLQGLGVDLENNLKRVLETGCTFHVKAVQYLTPANEARFLERTYMPLRNERNEITGLIAIGKDVTPQVIQERKQLEYQQGVRHRFEDQISKLEARLAGSEAEVDLLRYEIEESYKFHKLIAKNKKMRQIFNLISRIADSDSTVFLSGETGTGKELVAKAIHYNSYRQKKPFVAVNCAALTDTLLESELFGHVKGSFTGAIRDKRGKFELADGGTLFLDEAGELQPVTQGKLLRVLQEKEFEKVGGEETIRVDARIIAATNRDLDELVAQGKFRQDLYYRLKVIPINIPPLRERMDDLPLLAAFFLKKYCNRFKKDIVAVSQRALNKMLLYSWPGNVRELENVIEKTVVMSQSETIDDVDLPENEKGENIPAGLLKNPAIEWQVYLDECERSYFRELLSRFAGSIKLVSSASGLNRRTIHNKMKKYNLRKEDFK